MPRSMYPFKACSLMIALMACSLIASSAPVTIERVTELPAAKQPAWIAYLERSATAAAADQAVLDAELQAHGLAQALKAPNGGDFRPRYELNDPRFSTPELHQLADIVISFQAPSGGWSKHNGYSAGLRKPGMQWSSQYDPGRSPHYLCTFDNGATTAEITFLSMMWHATGREDCKTAVRKGLNYILAAQYPNGGWPQVYPLEGDYHDDITFNDDAMTNILEVLLDVIQDEPQYALIEAPLREKAAAAFEAGLRCVMEIQVRQPVPGTTGEIPVGWSAQYDALTFAPSVARLKEPIALASVESSSLLKFLMSIENPSPQAVASIEAGLAWLDRVKATNVRRAEIDGRQTYIEDNNSTDVLWARFYDIETNKPLFPGSEDGVIYNSYEAMARNNHSSGYDFYSSRPSSTVNSVQRKWRKRIAVTD